MKANRMQSLNLGWETCRFVHLNLMFQEVMPLLNGISGLTTWNWPLVRRCGSELGESWCCKWLEREVMWVVRVKTVWGAYGSTPEGFNLPLVLSFKEHELEKLDMTQEGKLQLYWFLISSTGFLCHSWCLAEKCSFGSFGPSEALNHWYFPTRAFSLGDFSACPVFTKILCAKNYPGDWQLKREPGNFAQKHVFWYLCYVFCRQQCKNEGTSESIIHIQSRTLILL